MTEISDVTKARPERVTPRPLQQRLQWITPLNPINQRITTLMNTSLARHLRDLKGVTIVVPAEWRGIECCASVYPELNSCSSSKTFYFFRPGTIAMDVLPLHHLLVFFCS